jgi:hypothetical protein
MTEELIICPACQSDACYKVSINETHYSYTCMGGGHYTNDLMKLEEFNFEEYESTLPELYKDLSFVDSRNRVWYPMVINIPEKGTVFISGNSIDNWQWTAIKTRPITEEEAESLSNKGIKYKSDAKSIKYFEKDFIEAIGYIGFFE